MSFFADLLGNAALSGAKIAGDMSEQEQALARQENESRLALERAKAVEVLREERARAAELEKRQRTVSQMDAVEQQAPAVTRARELAAAQQRAPSVDGNVLDTIKARLSPEQVEKFYGVDNSPVAKLDDRLAVARKGGMYDAEDMLAAARKETVAAMIEARKEREAAAKAARDERKDDQRDRQLDISASKVGSSGGSSNAAERLEVTRARERRLDIERRIDTTMAKVKERMITKEDGKKEIARLEDLQIKYQQEEDAAAAGKPTPAPGKPAAAAAAKPSSGYADGTLLKGPGGKTYIVKNGVPVPQ